MISHNTLLYNLLDRQFSVDWGGQNWIVNYTEGDLSELAQKLNESKIKYPIVWLQSGYTVQRDKMRGTIKLVGCKIFFITLGDANTRYKQRYENVYNDFLYKILLKFEKTIDKTKGVSSALIDEIRTFPLNDMAAFTEAAEAQKITIQDIWDAVELSTDLEISIECFPQLKINL